MTPGCTAFDAENGLYYFALTVPASASAFSAYVGIAVDVVCFFMALLSFRGISTRA